MKVEELIGITLYSETLEEAVNAIKENIKSSDIDMIAACAHGVGHLARRYEFRDNELIKEVTEACEKLGETGALVDMNDDLEHFVPESETLWGKLKKISNGLLWTLSRSSVSKS